MRSPEGQTRLVLASSSPRRRDLLAQLGLSFEVHPAELDERPLAREAPEAYVARLAREKARAVARRAPSACVLAADTTVVLDGELLGKPRDPEDAQATLLRLSGRTHEVLTGVAVVAAREAEAVVRTRVSFRRLQPAEVAWYVATGEPMDKAGSYAVQGRGAFLVASLEGSPTNVIGLPLPDTLELLRRVGFPLPWGVP